MKISNGLRLMRKKSFWTTANPAFDAQYVAKWVFGYIIFLLMYRWYAGKFLMDIALSPIMEPEVDNTFWMILGTGIPELIIENPNLCIVVDLLVIATACLSYIRKDKVWVTWSFLALFFIQTITVEAYTNSHSKTALCIFITALPFAFRNDYLIRLWEFARYFLGFIMVSSAISKLYYGGLFHTNQMQNILAQQHLDLMILSPESYQTKWIQWIFQQPYLANTLYYLAFATQLSFTLIFFTRKFDKILALFLLLFIANTYTLMRIYNMDLLIMIFPLWFSVLYFHQIYSKKQNQTTIIINSNI